MKISPVINCQVGLKNSAALKQSNNLFLAKNYQTDTFSFSARPSLRRKRFKNFVNFYEILQKNPSDEYSYNEFTKALKQCNISSPMDLKTSIKPENILGSGANSTVYQFDNPKLDKWVLKENSNYPESIEDSLKMTKDDFPGYNFGQEIAQFSNKYSILKKVTGEPHSIANWSEVIRNGSNVSREDSLDFLNSLDRIQDFPQSSFDDYASQLKMISEKGYKQDSINPNNILIDYDKQKIQIIDFFKAVRAAHVDSRHDLFNVLLDFPLFSYFYDNLNPKEQKELIQYASTITKKCTIASKKVGIKQDEKIFLDYLANVDKYFGEALLNIGGDYRTRYDSMKEILQKNS